MQQEKTEAEEEHDKSESAPSVLMELVESAPGEERGGEPAAAPEPTDFVGFYGLAENPFSDSVNPAYFYKTDLHEETYIRMMLAVRHNISLGLVTGRSGTGKTLLSQMVLQNLDPVLCRPVLVLVSPGMSKTALLREMLSELDLPLPEGPFVRTQELLKQLGDHVMALHEEGRKLVVLIDECHFLSAEALHILRTLSNIEVPEQKLLTCLLFAEERFLKRLEHPSYESLRNRMYLRSELQPLSADECAQYVKFRLLVAGRADPLFTEEALGLVHARTGGICRRINKLCMLSLIEGYLRRRPVMDHDVVRHCAEQL